jgi:uncharacterized membrane protein
MNKGRVETLSDSIFAVAMTLLVFDIRVPTVVGPVTDQTLLHQLGTLTPLFVIYVVSFIVLAVIWTNHHFVFHRFAKEVDRRLNNLNMLYLMFVVFVPFSAELIGTYVGTRAAVIVYGLNIFAIVFLSFLMIVYILKNDHLSQDEISMRLIRQARFRSFVSLLFYPLGILCAFVWIPASIFFYAFPVVFNFIPGTLDFLERHSPLDFGD